MSASLIVIIILVEVVVILGVVLGVSLNKIKKLKQQINTAPVVVENAAYDEKDNSSERVKANDTVEENDDASSEYLLEQQSKTIEHLKEFISRLLSNIDPKALPNKELDSHFEKLEQDNIQLVQCVAILEDENGFLRDQIEALLKLEK